MTNTDSDNSREWAAQAYALLKKRQEEQKQDLKKQEEQKQVFDSANTDNISESSKTIDESELGFQKPKDKHPAKKIKLKDHAKVEYSHNFLLPNSFPSYLNI